MQDLLTALAELIVFCFTVIFLFDLAIALNNCWIASARKLPSPHELEAAATLQIQPESKDLSSVMPDPWTLPPDEALSRHPSEQRATSQLKPLLLLQQVTIESNLDELLSTIDIDKLQLRRRARKIAKALGIAQKVNKKDQPISWLRAQIKAKLQQPQALPATTILAVKEAFAS